MSNGSTCPICATDIGFWAISGAETWSHIHCPCCNAQLTYKRFPWPQAIVGAVLCACALAAWLWLALVLQIDLIMAIVIGVLASVAMFDLYIVRRLRKKHQLVLVGHTSKP